MVKMIESDDNHVGTYDGVAAQDDRVPKTSGDGADDSAQGSIQRDGIVLSFEREEVFLGGHAVDLSSTEYRILKFLVALPGKTFSRRQILDGLHGQRYAITERAVDTQIVGLRRKLGVWADCIETVWGAGYRFRP